jgi:hypothetical protein
MARQDSYQQWLKEDLSKLIDTLEVSDFQKHCLRSRWLDQILWMEGNANRARNRYYLLRLTTVIGGVIIPALVSLNTPAITGMVVGDGTNLDLGWVAPVAGWAAFVLSLVVALSAAVEQFFNYGERWRHYRRMVESLKVEGWQFLQLSGPYRRYQKHTEAYRAFAARTEELHQHDVEAYITSVVREQEEDGEGKSGRAAAGNQPEGR